MQAYKIILLTGTLGLSLILSACDMTTPSSVNTSKLTVKDQILTDTLSADHVDLKKVAAIARKVANSGDHEVSLTIPFVPGGNIKAGDLGSAYKNAFAARHVTHVSVNLVPVADSNETSNVIATYQALVAKQAEDCTRIPGYQGTEDLSNYGDYKFGCETQGNMARMIDDPSDLLGKQNAPEANSRRNGAIIEPYMVGTPNQPLKGMTASSIGAQ